MAPDRDFYVIVLNAGDDSAHKVKLHPGNQLRSGQSLAILFKAPEILRICVKGVTTLSTDLMAS